MSRDLREPKGPTCGSLGTGLLGTAQRSVWWAWLEHGVAGRRGGEDSEGPGHGGLGRTVASALRCGSHCRFEAEG